MEPQDEPGQISPELACSIRETLNAWERVEAEFGLLTGREVAALIMPETSDLNRIADLDQAGQLIGVTRRGEARYPGFQFDSNAGSVFPAIPELIIAARANGWTNEDLMMWMCSPTSFLVEEDRPVDHIRETGRILAAAIDEFEGG